MAPSPPCAVCKKDIASVRIECAECANVVMCIECFATGSEAPELGHTRHHSYKCVAPPVPRAAAGARARVARGRPRAGANSPTNNPNCDGATTPPPPPAPRAGSMRTCSPSACTTATGRRTTS